MSISNTATAALAASYYQAGTITPTGATGQTRTATQPQTTTFPPSANGDTVHLSATAQANALYQQGRTISQIAYSLDVSTQTVDGYLAITPTPASTGTGVAAPTGGAAASGANATNTAAAGTGTGAASTGAASTGATATAPAAIRTTTTGTAARTGGGPPPPVGSSQASAATTDNATNTTTNNTTAKAQVKSATY